jgi:hypothetical protein
MLHCRMTVTHYHKIRSRYLEQITKLVYSTMAQWKRAGLITLRSLDRNKLVLIFFVPVLIIFSFRRLERDEQDNGN